MNNSSLPLLLPPKTFSDKLKSLAETIGQYSPLIVIFGVWVITLFNDSVMKGVTYILFIIFALLLRLGGIKCVDTSASSVVPTTMSSTTPSTKCSMGTGIYGDNETLGMYIISFTMFYVCFPMFLLNNVNWGLLIFFMFTLIFSVLINKSCIMMCKGAAAVNVIIGGLIGVAFSAFVYTYANAVSIINKASSNAETCGIPSQQTFRCLIKD
jgi:hypothetical protein